MLRAIVIPYHCLFIPIKTLVIAVTLNTTFILSLLISETCSVTVVIIVAMVTFTCKYACLERYFYVWTIFSKKIETSLDLQGSYRERLRKRRKSPLPLRRTLENFSSEMCIKPFEGQFILRSISTQPRFWNDLWKIVKRLEDLIGEQAWRTFVTIFIQSNGSLAVFKLNKLTCK